MNSAREKIGRHTLYSVEEALAKVKAVAAVKFDETVDVAIRLGVNPKHADQMVRGVVGLPNGTGKDVRVAVFARGPKADEAKEAGEEGMEIWGAGSPMREFLHADDCADGLVFLMKHYSEAEHMNLGSGTDIRIDDLARMVMDVVGLKGELRKDTSKPDGTPKKLMDNARIAALGWTPKISLREGIEGVYRDAPFRGRA